MEENEHQVFEAGPLCQSLPHLWSLAISHAMVRFHKTILLTQLLYSFKRDSTLTSCRFLAWYVSNGVLQVMNTIHALFAQLDQRIVCRLLWIFLLSLQFDTESYSESALSWASPVLHKTRTNSASLSNVFSALGYVGGDGRCSFLPFRISCKSLVISASSPDPGTHALAIRWVFISAVVVVHHFLATTGRP